MSTIPRLIHALRTEWTAISDERFKAHVLDLAATTIKQADRSMHRATNQQIIAALQGQNPDTNPLTKNILAITYSAKKVKANEIHETVHILRKGFQEDTVSLHTGKRTISYDDVPSRIRQHYMQTREKDYKAALYGSDEHIRHIDEYPKAG